jgi:endoglucanase
MWFGAGVVRRRGQVALAGLCSTALIAAAVVTGPGAPGTASPSITQPLAAVARTPEGSAPKPVRAKRSPARKKSNSTTVVSTSTTTSPSTSLAGPATSTPTTVASGRGGIAGALADRSVWWRGVNLAGAEFGVASSPTGGSWGPDPRQGKAGRDYAFPTVGDLDYTAEKGMNAVRIPISWERVQPELSGPLHAPYFAELRKVVDGARQRGLTVIIDVHGYARYRRPGANAPGVVGSPELEARHLADLWRRIATSWPSDPAVHFGLMNEPHDMSTAQWRDAANETIAAIRSVGASNLVLVAGNNWSGGWTWFEDFNATGSNAEVMTGIVDPMNWWMFEIHQYPDADGSGYGLECVDSKIFSRRLIDLTAWLRRVKRPAVLGEFSVGNNPTCAAALADGIEFMERNGDVWKGWLYWAGGSFWSDSLNTLEPWRNASGQTQDRPQMDILERFLANSAQR